MLRVHFARTPGAGWAVIRLRSSSNFLTLAIDEVLDLPADLDGEVTAFFPGYDVVQLRTRTDGTGRAVTLHPPVRLPMVVYVCSDSDAVLATVRDHVANLNYLLNGRNGAGIVFDAELNVIPRDTFERIQLGCRHVEQLKGSPYYAEGRLNVYYHGQSIYRNGPALTATCDHDVIFMRPHASIDTLAHEAGHALGIRAARENGYDDIAAPASWPWNVMQLPSATLRDHFSLGQMYCMRFSPLSFAIRHEALGLPNAATPGPLPEIPWVFDDASRQPQGDLSDKPVQPGLGQVETRQRLARQLEARHDQLCEYWQPSVPGGEPRPEGELGHADREEFVKLHAARQLDSY